MSYREQGEGREVLFWSNHALFEPGGFVAVGARSVVFATGRRVQFRQWSFGGLPIKTVEVPMERSPVKARDLALIREWADTANVPSAVKDYARGLQPGTLEPFHGELILDRVGRIWMGEYITPFGPESLLEEWIVVSDVGVPIARMADVEIGEILEIGFDYMLILLKDDLAVERVAEHAIDAGG